MDWYAWFDTAAGAASLGGLVIDVILGLVTWRLTKATDQLIHEGNARPHQLLAEGEARTHNILHDMQAQTRALLERMDERTARMDERTVHMEARAEERHREALELIQRTRR